MHRWIALLMFVLLPFQASWAAVASYCAHEAQVGASHLGHHAHEHHAKPSVSAQADAATSAPDDTTAGSKAPGADDFDCGQCHGSCSAMLTLPSALPDRVSTTGLHPTVDEDGGAHASTRPERPQWRSLA